MIFGRTGAQAANRLAIISKVVSNGGRCFFSLLFRVDKFIKLIAKFGIVRL
jgi:hypothetical protein